MKRKIVKIEEISFFPLSFYPVHTVLTDCVRILISC
jgi:hypothetical protein